MMAANLDGVFHATQVGDRRDDRARQRRRDRQHRLDRGPPPGPDPRPLRHHQGGAHHVHPRLRAWSSAATAFASTRFRRASSTATASRRAWPEGVQALDGGRAAWPYGDDDDVADAVLFLVSPAVRLHHRRQPRRRWRHHRPPGILRQPMSILSRHGARRPRHRRHRRGARHRRRHRRSDPRGRRHRRRCSTSTKRRRPRRPRATRSGRGADARGRRGRDRRGFAGPGRGSGRRARSAGCTAG